MSSENLKCCLLCLVYIVLLLAAFHYKYIVLFPSHPLGGCFRHKINCIFKKKPSYFPLLYAVLLKFQRFEIKTNIKKESKSH